MADYRRIYVPGGTYFFTLVTRDRMPWLADDTGRAILGDAMRLVRARRPFRTRAIVVLPDHLHCMWTLPPDDPDFSGRWKSIKQRCTAGLKRARQFPGGAWQRHFWEHLIRDEEDFRRHVEYIHYNPVKHGLCEQPRDWAASSFHRYVAVGAYRSDWAESPDLDHNPE